MPNQPKQFTLTLIVLAWTIAIPISCANAHFGGYIVQLQDGHLLVGQDSETPGGQPDWNTQAIGSLFAPDQYSDLPSFLSLANPPSGTQALPINTSIYWDFLPMTTGGYTSNLLYWNGQGAVNFGPVPVPSGATDVTMGYYNTTDSPGFSALVSDTPDMIEGNLLGVTNNSGTGLRMHRHNYILLDDGDGVLPTNIAEGVYVFAVQLYMAGYGTSKPVFIVPGTHQLVTQNLSALNTAVAWVETNASLLIRDGDYDFDGDVDAADHATWKKQFGSTSWPIDGDFADGTRNGVVDAGDYVVWRKNLPGGGVGTGALAGGGSTVPEPSVLVMCAWAAGTAILLLRKRNRKFSS